MSNHRIMISMVIIWRSFTWLFIMIDDWRLIMTMIYMAIIIIMIMIMIWLLEEASPEMSELASNQFKQW